MSEPTNDPEHADEIAQLRALADEVRPTTVDWEAPPEGLWERIAAEAGVATDHSGGSGDATPVADLDHHRGRRAGAPRRQGLMPWMLGAAAVVTVGLLTVGVLAAVRTDDATVLAAGDLDPLGVTAEGHAELVDDDGTLHLRVDTTGLDAEEGFLEVWIIDPDVTQLISLGPHRADGVYDLPAGIEPESFPVVDVSVEPLDGDPTHSGNSVLRGVLEF